MRTITKAVIPAAGLGTRLDPISRYLPKAMLPLGKKPVLEHIVEELKKAGLEEIAIVTRSEYNTIFDYFGDDTAVTFIKDDSGSGPGGALLKAREFVNGHDFVVAFADAPLRGVGRLDFLQQLMTLKKSRGASASLAMYPVEPSEASSRGVVLFEEQQAEPGSEVTVTDMLEKPSQRKEALLWASACRYVLDQHIFGALDKIDADQDGELQLTTAIRHMLGKGHRVLGYPLAQGLTRYDTGNFEDYYKAVCNFADEISQGS